MADTNDKPPVAINDVPTKFSIADIVNDKTEAMSHFGLAWSVETVNVEVGGNAAQKMTASDDAQILAITDVDNFRANFPNGTEIILGIANGTSLRVMSQDVNRRQPKKTVVERRQMILNRLAGVRNAGIRTVVTKVVEVVKFRNTLPGGGVYEGTDESEYQRAYATALVDAGVPSETALSIARNQKLQ